MDVKAGDHLVVRGRTVSQPDRNAEVLKVLGADGGPPYQVRWSDDGHEGLFFPGADTSVEKAEKPVKAVKAAKAARKQKQPPQDG
jgi:hypothetical protein